MHYPTNLWCQNSSVHPFSNFTSRTGYSGPSGRDTPFSCYHYATKVRIINRTVVYGALTVKLALVYFGGVTTPQAIFRTLTGQEE
jgi:hypothetical protein